MVNIGSIKFGDTLLYTSLRTQRTTPCIYVRQQNKTTAVVLFKHAQKVAKVSYERLKYPVIQNDELDGFFNEYL